MVIENRIAELLTAVAFLEMNISKDYGNSYNLRVLCASAANKVFVS